MSKFTLLSITGTKLCAALFLLGPTNDAFACNPTTNPESMPGSQFDGVSALRAFEPVVRNAGKINRSDLTKFQSRSWSDLTSPDAFADFYASNAPTAPNKLKHDDDNDNLEIECIIEEVLVTAQAAGGYAYIPSMGFAAFILDLGRPVGSTVNIVEPDEDDEVHETPYVNLSNEPSNFGCSTKVHHFTRPFANQAFANWFGGLSYRQKIIQGTNLSGEPTKVTYPNGEHEIWIVNAPSNPTMALRATPEPDTCVDPG